jgi:hypothetical protein
MSRLHRSTLLDLGQVLKQRVMAGWAAGERVGVAIGVTAVWYGGVDAQAIIGKIVLV